MDIAMDSLVQKFIFDVYGNENVLFINAQGLESGSDYDIYCVVKEEIRSCVKIFEFEGVWVEIFVDNIIDMKSKIGNSDDICASFIQKMHNYYSYGDAYREALALIPQQYVLSDKRKNLLYYRIKVLFSKYLGVKTQGEKKYFKGQILPQLMLLAFDDAGIWPHSPKNWFRQLEESGRDFSQQVLASHENDLLFEDICCREEHKFLGIDIEKEGRDNSVTFLG